MHLPQDYPLHEALGIRRPAVVATVGGGGKTTILFALAAEWAAGRGEGLSVLCTTTKMTIPREGRALPLVIGRNEASRAGALADLRQRDAPTAIVGSGRGDRERVLAVETDWPRAATQAGLASLVAVEADGSKGRPFKAPASHEPVIPSDAHVVVAVMGAGVFGRPLDDRAVHRPERVAEIAGVRLGAEVTPQVAAAVLTSDEGGRKNVPDSARFVILISSAARNIEASRQLASLCDTDAVLWDVGADLLEAWQDGQPST